MLGDLVELDAGEFTIAGRASVGRSELGMVCLRTIGESVAESESPFAGDLLLEGEWLVLDPFSFGLGIPFTAGCEALRDGPC